MTGDDPTDGDDVEEGGDVDSGDDVAGDDEALTSLLESYRLKDERRTGWQLRGVTEPESVAAHSWGVSLLCLVFGPEAGDEVDVDRALRLAVVHDLAEARTGDVPTRAADVEGGTDGADEKHSRERQAMADIADPLENVAEPWEAYEARDSETARFVKDMDLVDMCLQALLYERDARYDPNHANHGDAFDEYDRLDEFFATAAPRLRTDVGRRLFERIRDRYEAAKRARHSPESGSVGADTGDADDESMDL